VELEESLDEFRAQGLGVAALSYDQPEVLRHFIERAGPFSYPILADPDSRIIRDFGILNHNFPEDHTWYGIPFPGTFLVDETGIVREKFFEQMHRQRFTADTILVKEFGVGGGKRVEVQTDHLKLTTYLSQDEARRGNRITLILDLELPERMHVYAPGVTNYKPIEVQLDPHPMLLIHHPEYPESSFLHLEAIQETVPVYETRARIFQDVTLSPKLTAERLELTGRFEYQACDDRICYVPTTVPLAFTLDLVEHDSERVPENLRRKSDE
jgi:hypothetical protein